MISAEMLMEETRLYWEGFTGYLEFNLGGSFTSHLWHFTGNDQSGVFMDQSSLDLGLICHVLFCLSATTCTFSLCMICIYYFFFSYSSARLLQRCNLCAVQSALACQHLFYLKVLPWFIFVHKNTSRWLKTSESRNVGQRRVIMFVSASVPQGRERRREGARMRENESD